MPAALLIDMDGTLLDTEPLHFEAHRRFLATVGIVPTEAELSGNIGKGDVTFYEEYQRRYGKTGDAVAWLEEKTRLLIGLYRSQGVRLNPGAEALLEQAWNNGITCLIVTSSERRLAAAALEAAGLARRLPLRVTREDTLRHKPHPEPYLLACQRLSLAAGSCLVIEDSPSGVASGRTAGCPVAALSGHFDAASLRAAGAQQVVARLDELLPLAS